VEQVTGKTWEEFVKSRLFVPLGMSGSNFSVLESQKSPDYALPYTIEKDSIKEIPFRNITEIGPAGSINSNAVDMAKWVALQLNKGKAGDVQVISEASLAQIHSPQMVMPGARDFTEFLPSSYAMGWMVQPYRGHLRIHHGGNIDGFSALVSFLPDDNIGMVVLTNMNGSGFPGVVSLYASDLLLKLDPVDWHGRFRSRIDKAREEEKKQKEKDPERKPGTSPSHPLTEYTGKYDNPGYGVMIIEYTGKDLKARFNSFNLSLEHWHYDVFRGTDRDNPGTKLMFTFLTNAKGDIEGFTIPLELLVKEIKFTRQPPDQLADPKFLAQFAGEYDMSGQTVKVMLKGTRGLVLSVPGQPQYDLEPYRGTEFNLKGLSGYSLKFTIDEKNGVTGVTFIQPNGLFKATKKK
jgi:CubicO group peptidase (beta-lactamase class C family)